MSMYATIHMVSHNINTEVTIKLVIVQLYQPGL